MSVNMKLSPEIAIIEANTLTCMGLRGLIERMMPQAVVRTFNSFEQLMRDTPACISTTLFQPRPLWSTAPSLWNGKKKPLCLPMGQPAPLKPPTSYVEYLPKRRQYGACIAATATVCACSRTTSAPRYEEAHIGNHSLYRPQRTQSSRNRSAHTHCTRTDEQGNCRPLVYRHYHRYLPPQEHHGKTQCPLRIGLTIYAVMNGYIEADRI